MRRIHRSWRVALSAATLACVFTLAASDLRAGDDDKAKKRDTTKVAKRGSKHLAYKKTYADALLEARIRNMPIFISRHKDF